MRVVFGKNFISIDQVFPAMFSASDIITAVEMSLTTITYNGKF
jgi:hypothetical protein